MALFIFSPKPPTSVGGYHQKRLCLKSVCFRAHCSLKWIIASKFDNDAIANFLSVTLNLLQSPLLFGMDYRIEAR